NATRCTNRGHWHNGFVMGRQRHSKGAARAAPTPSTDPVGPEPPNRPWWRIAEQRGLTPRQTEVLIRACYANQSADIDAELRSPVHAVDFHLRRLFAKFGVHSRFQVMQCVANDCLTLRYATRR